MRFARWREVATAYRERVGMSKQHVARAGENGQKSNEINAIPELLKLLSIKGCIVTIDAMGCQKAITKAIVDSEADTCLTSNPTTVICTSKWRRGLRKAMKRAFLSKRTATM